jgi:hypothetical protein
MATVCRKACGVIRQGRRGRVSSSRRAWRRTVLWIAKRVSGQYATPVKTGPVGATALPRLVGMRDRSQNVLAVPQFVALTVRRTRRTFSSGFSTPLGIPTKR